MSTPQQNLDGVLAILDRVLHSTDADDAIRHVAARVLFDAGYAEYAAWDCPYCVHRIRAHRLEHRRDVAARLPRPQAHADADCLDCLDCLECTP